MTLEKMMNHSKREKRIWVVSGLPRSGTSLMMSMLKAGGLSVLEDNTRTADIDNPKGYFEYAPVKDLDKTKDTSWLGLAEGKGIKVVSPLLKYLPDGYHYNVMFIRRNLKEILLSQRKMLLRLGTMDQASDAGLFDAYLSHLTKINAFLKISPKFSVSFFDYHALLNDPKAQALRISQFVDVPLDEPAMAGKVDPALYRSGV